MWLAGTEIFEDIPGITVNSAGANAPKGLDSFCEVSLANLGCPNDNTCELIQKLTASPRFKMASISIVLPNQVGNKMSAARYRKNDMVMTDSGYPHHVLWGTDPMALYKEAEDLTIRMYIGGWEEDPVFWPESCLSTPGERTDKVYYLVEKPVVDLDAAAKKLAGGLIRGAWTNILIGILIGLLLSVLIRM